jgi:hypothetical protein
MTDRVRRLFSTGDIFAELIDAIDSLLEETFECGIGDG